MNKTPEAADGGLLSDLLEKVTAGKRKRSDGDETIDESQVAPPGNMQVVSKDRQWTEAERLQRGIQEPLLRTHSPGQLSFVQLCNDLNMSPPKTWDGHLLDEPHVLHRIAQDGFGKQYTMDTETKKFLLFLYGSEFKRNDPQSARIEAIAKILTPSNVPNVRGPYERLQRIVHIDSDSDVHHLGGNVKAYCREWQEIVRSWGNLPRALTVFNCAQITIVHRRQLASNCFLQAAAAAHKYLVQMGSGEDKGMLDLAKYVRNQFNSDDLEKYLLTDLGGDTRHFFLLLADLKPSQVIHLKSENIEADLLVDVTEPSPETGNLTACWKRLVEFGPAVVTHFLVAEDFRRFKQRPAGSFVLPRFSEPVTKTMEGDRHAMLLVGMHFCCIDRKWHLLLQNWWDDMQFLDVTAEYFHSTGAQLIFCTKRLTSYLPNIPTLASAYAETSIDGADVPHVGNLDVKVCQNH